MLLWRVGGKHIIFSIKKNLTHLIDIKSILESDHTRLWHLRLSYIGQKGSNVLYGQGVFSKYLIKKLTFINNVYLENKLILNLIYYNIEQKGLLIIYT